MEVRYRPQAERDGVGELSPADQENGLQDLLLAEPVGAQRFDIAGFDLRRLAVKLGAEVQKRLVSDRNLCVNVVDSRSAPVPALPSATCARFRNVPSRNTC